MQSWLLSAWYTVMKQNKGTKTKFFNTYYNARSVLASCCFLQTCACSILRGHSPLCMLFHLSLVRKDAFHGNATLNGFHTATGIHLHLTCRTTCYEAAHGKELQGDTSLHLDSWKRPVEIRDFIIHLTFFLRFLIGSHLPATS